MSQLARPVTGQPAPPVSLEDDAGQPWRLADHRGSTVLLIFHRHIH